LIQQPPSWWLPKLLERFELSAFNRVPNGFWVIVEREVFADHPRKSARDGSSGWFIESCNMYLILLVFMSGRWRPFPGVSFSPTKCALK